MHAIREYTRFGIDHEIVSKCKLRCFLCVELKYVVRIGVSLLLKANASVRNPLNIVKQLKIKA